MPAGTMTDRPKTARTRSKRTPEFMVYFTILFILAIPFGTVEWVIQMFSRCTLNLRGPLARAWAEADRITPLIFSK